ncbi:hypothetical protein CBR_g48661 [Chara braunii]|uniref:BED-type domain-containing protein n=1 Tax=Chara braunii TaxID=69332 RepID=A0A388K4P0_CHABU|nr:hypothetical protein CBR_g48661 [Chara braunii]|eukprot:GBG64913.1 hypothetical protein CBR_g48661 [Chara braunii]
MTWGAGGSGDGDFVPATDVQMDELRRKSRVWRHVMQGQRMGTWQKRHGNYKLRCNYCKHVWQGTLFKAQRHFTQLKRCAATTMDVFVDIWNHTEYEFDERHHRGIMAYMREHNIADRRAVDVHQGSGRGRTGGTQSRPRERDAVEEVEEFLAEEARRAEARGGEEGGGAGPARDLPGENVVMTARGKMQVESGVEGVPQGAQETAAVKTGQGSWLRHKKQLASMARGVRPVYPSFKDIGGAGIDEQRGKVAAMLREVRSSFESIGATILSDGRQSRDARPIVNFLAAAKRGALLYATVQRDGSVSETAHIVLKRWKAIFRSFPPKDVLAICTDSASNYTSAAKLLAKDSDPDIRRITWLLCATHVANLMLSDIGTRVPWVTDTIFRARALVRFIKSHGAAYHLFRLIRCADFWRNVHHAVAVMTLVHQLLRRLDRGGMIMSTMYSWSQELVRQVAAADVPDDMRGPCVEAVQIRTMHMLEPAHAAADLLNPRRRSLRYYESARRTAADLEVVTQCDSFLLAQTGGDRAGDAYLRVREQMRSFHSRGGHHTERVTRDAEAEACVGDEETSRCASWWVEHGACFPDLQEIAGRVMHMWTSASPAERNWAEHERIHTAKRNKLEFRKVAQLVEIATNLKLLGCSERSGGTFFATLAEAQPEEYTHPVVADEDEEEEPEPEEWGARPQTTVPAHEIVAQVRRFQQQGARRPVGVAEVFGARAEILHPYDYVPPPPAEPVQASEEQTDTEVGEDLPPGVDKSAERLYYTYGGGADGFLSRCTFIRESDDDPIPVTDIGLDGGQRDEDDADDDDDDDEPLLLRRARLAQQGAARPAPAAEGLRRSARLQQTQAGSTSSGRREASDHLDDIRDEEHLPSQHTPASAPRGDSQQRELRTSDFQGLGPGFAGSGVRGRIDGRERVGDEAKYHSVQGGGPESVEELHAPMDREEEQRL